MVGFPLWSCVGCGACFFPNAEHDRQFTHASASIPHLVAPAVPVVPAVSAVSAVPAVGAIVCTLFLCVYATAVLCVIGTVQLCSEVGTFSRFDNNSSQAAGWF